MGNKLEAMYGGRDKSTIYSTGFAYNTNCDWKFEDAKSHICSILDSLRTDIAELDDALWQMNEQYARVSEGVPSSAEVHKLQRVLDWVHEVTHRYEMHLSTYWTYRDNIGFSDCTPEEKKLIINDPKYIWDKRKEEKRCERN